MSSLQPNQGPLSVPPLPLIWDESCRRDPLYWAQNWTKTENPHYLEQKLEFRAPFPKKSYFVPVFQWLASIERGFIPKSREMLTSWSVMIYATQRAQWFKSEVVIQTETEDKAKELIGYASTLYENQPEWLKAMHPLKSQASSLSIEWQDGGRMFGIPHGQHKIRMYHPTIVVFDELAFMTEAEASYNAANPVAKQIIGISSAGPGWFAEMCQK